MPCFVVWPNPFLKTMEIHFGRSESYERVVLKNEDYREDYMVYVGGVEE